MVIDFVIYATSSGVGLFLASVLALIISLGGLTFSALMLINLCFNHMSRLDD